MKHLEARLTWLKRHWLISTALCLALAGTGGGVWLYAASHHLSAPPPGGACGTLRNRFLAGDQYPNAQTVRADVQEPIVACFWRAFVACAPATLTSLYGGVDTSTQIDLTIVGREQPCAISVTWDQDVSGTSDHTSFHCTALTRQITSLVVSACDRGGSLPLDPDLITYPCNAAGNAQKTLLAPTQAHCFLQGYQFCYARGVSSPGDDNPGAYWINSHCGISTSGNLGIAACTTFKEEADGLHFLGCGPYGNPFLPVSSE